MSAKIGLLTLMKKDSVRFPNKNTTAFLGLPLYMHTINFGRLLSLPYWIIHNYEFLYLPSGVIEINDTPTFENIRETYQEHNLMECDIFVLLQVTSPIRNIEQIRAALQVFEDSKKLCAFSVRTIKEKYFYMHHVPVNFLREDRTYDGGFRQDLVYETGAFYFFRKEQLQKQHILDAYSNEIMTFEDAYGIDIDYREDIQRIEERVKACQT